MPKEQEQGEQQALPLFLVVAILNLWTEHFQRVRNLQQYLRQQQPLPQQQPQSEEKDEKKDEKSEK